jgi:hypothetical protein
MSGVGVYEELTTPNFSLDRMKCPHSSICNTAATGPLHTDVSKWASLLRRCSSRQQLHSFYCIRYGTVYHFDDNGADRGNGTTTAGTHRLLSVIPGLPPWAHMLIWAGLLLLGVGLLGLAIWQIARRITDSRR